MAGRRVEIPARISRVLAAGPPASNIRYTLAPEKMIGWVRTPGPTEKAYLQESVRELPEYGRLTGRGGTANLENVLKFQPDLIIDSGSTGGTYVSLANNVQEQTKIPYLLLDGRLEKTPEIYRLLGNGRCQGPRRTTRQLRRGDPERAKAAHSRNPRAIGRGSTTAAASTALSLGSPVQSTWRSSSAWAPSTSRPRPGRGSLSKISDTNKSWRGIPM